MIPVESKPGMVDYRRDGFFRCYSRGRCERGLFLVGVFVFILLVYGLSWLLVFPG